MSCRIASVNSATTITTAALNATTSITATTTAIAAATVTAATVRHSNTAYVRMAYAVHRQVASLNICSNAQWCDHTHMGGSRKDTLYELLAVYVT
jgi:hypothetical protein